MEAIVGTEAMQRIATSLFIMAVLHTFAAKKIRGLGRRLQPGSGPATVLYVLGEIEVAFGLWAMVLILIWSMRFGTAASLAYLESVHFTEPIFVLVTMVMAATRPILRAVAVLIEKVASLLPMPAEAATYVTTLILGPLLGSIITEPATMAVTALLLGERFFLTGKSHLFRYVTLALLFVNVSIGGTLTHFAAPPVLLVARTWNWDTAFMLSTFGWRAVLCIVSSTLLTAGIFRRELQQKISTPSRRSTESPVPFWIIVVQVLFLGLSIANAPHLPFFMPLFLLFIGWCTATRKYQTELKLKEGLLVAFFLGGLVTLGNLQAWWLQPVLEQLNPLALFWGALTLTAVLDNAALTYLGTLVPSLSAAAKYALVAGAVGGGGLTVIANAPNMVGWGLLNRYFGDDGIRPLPLLAAAMPYTLWVAIVFLL